MSRSWTESECREIEKDLKAANKLPWDYDEFCKLLDEGKLFSPPKFPESQDPDKMKS